MADKMVNCKSCNSQIAKSAKNCPQCGAKNKKPIYTKWWLWVIVVIVIAIIVTPSSSVKKEVETGNTTPQVQNGTSTKQDSNVNEELSFALNETAVFSNLKITALDIKTSSGDTFLKPNDGNVFVGVQFQIENTSDKEQTISSLLLFDMYADDVKVDLSFMALGEFGDGTIDGELSPNKKMIGWIPIEVNKDTKHVEFEVKSNWLSNNKAVFKFDLN